MQEIKLPAALLATRRAGGGWIKADRLHFRTPPRVVIAAFDRLVANVLPEMRHFMREDGKDLLVSLADEMIRVQVDFVLMIRAAQPVIDLLPLLLHAAPSCDSTAIRSPATSPGMSSREVGPVSSSSKWVPGSLQPSSEHLNWGLKSRESARREVKLPASSWPRRLTPLCPMVRDGSLRSAASDASVFVARG